MEPVKEYSEWFFQSDYDLETAEAMFNSGRNVYCIFMCHLSIEKALKGLLLKVKGTFPPKSHNLLYLTELIELELSLEDYDFILSLNKISIPTRYPEDLKKMIAVYPNERTTEILMKSKSVQSWIKQQ